MMVAVLSLDIVLRMVTALMEVVWVLLWERNAG